MHSALELFSGIGAFAVGVAGLPVRVVQAFDQNDAANHTYRLNFSHSPSSRNLDGIGAGELPAADLWWLSPPCTPYSVRGHRKDDSDPRAASFLNLIALLPAAGPRALIVENVTGFVGSRVHERLRAGLGELAYQVEEIDLCPTQFGVPMRRPRRYVVAARGRAPGVPPAPVARAVAPLAGFLDADPAPELEVPDGVVAQYGRAFNVIEPDDPDAIAICVTAGYRRSVRSAGSFLRLPGGGVRRLSPGEVLRLLGFPSGFRFPPEVPVSTHFRLVGNSVDVRAVRFLVEPLIAGM